MMEYIKSGTPKSSLILALFASLIFVVVPYLNLTDNHQVYIITLIIEKIQYPFILFVTFIHETGHAIMAYMTGGSVRSMAIASDGSGLTEVLTHKGLSSILVSNAGYMASTVYGSIMLIWANRTNHYRAILRTSAYVIFTALIVFTVFSSGWVASLAGTSEIGIGMRLFSIAWGLIISGGLWLIAAKVNNESLLAFLTNFLAVQCIFNAIVDIKTVMQLAVYSDIRSDAVNLASQTGIPAVLWSLTWGIASMVIVYFSLQLSMQKTK